MRIVERGAGDPLVVVPGIQGRWEYVAPAIDALAESFRVFTFALCGEPGSPPVDPRKGLDNFSEQIGCVLGERGLERAAICGISFGGLAALRFAAGAPARTAALVLVSTPGPGWHLRRRHEVYARLPWLFGPIFIAEAPFRVRAEISAAIPERRARLRFAWQQLRTWGSAGLSLSQVALRAKLIAAADIAGDCRRVLAPTLIVSGDPLLDHVVPADGASQYVDLIRGARAVRLEETGHLGSITRPEAFAAVVRDFIRPALGEPRDDPRTAAAHPTPARRRLHTSEHDDAA
jgi:pimeloyl-ACP methyl ester carboxylesterase